MKGTAVNIKFAEQSRVARYGIALTVALHAVWRGLVRFFAPGDFDRRAGCAAGADRFFDAAQGE